MLQQVLTIRGTVFHLTDNADEFWMQTMYTEVDGSTFTGLDNFILKLFLNFGNNLFDTSWMDASVGHQLVECQTASLTANGVESRDDDSLGGVVDYDFNTAGSLQGTDITTLTTNHTTLDVVVVNVEHGN